MARPAICICNDIMMLLRLYYQQFSLSIYRLELVYQYVVWPPNAEAYLFC